MSSKRAMGEPTMSDEQVAAWVEMAKSGWLKWALSNASHNGSSYKRELQRHVERNREYEFRAEIERGRK